MQDRKFDQFDEIDEISPLEKNNFTTLITYGDQNIGLGDWEKAIDYYKKGIDIALENGFLEGLFRIYLKISEIYQKREEYERALEFIDKSNELLNIVDDKYLIADFYSNFGFTLTQVGRYSEAYEYLVESFDFFKNLQEKDKIIESALRFVNYFLKVNHSESVEYYLSYSLRVANEIHNSYYLALTKYFQALNNYQQPSVANECFQYAIDVFKENQHCYELYLVQFAYATFLLAQDNWAEALKLLSHNKEILNIFKAIRLIEKNDLLIQQITDKYATEIMETKFDEMILSKYTQLITQLKQITNLEKLLAQALSSIIEFAQADGGMLFLFCHHHLNNDWEYCFTHGITSQHDDYNIMQELILKTYLNKKNINLKQPVYSEKYNDLATFTLTLRNHVMGVLLIFSKHENYYFTEKLLHLVDAIANQLTINIENIRYDILNKAHNALREELVNDNSFHNIIGKSEKIIQIFELIQKVKDAPTSVFLQGASGTGKELIARAIHFHGNRKNKNFIAQYCGAIPETLLESELFGHVKGSFTGAVNDKKGLIEIADGGTFFLDEIADISPSIQVKLLRFLQEGEVKRVGSLDTKKVDVRIICATNVNLEEKVNKGEFRLDLFYRLNVIKIDVPTLNERSADIPLLAVHFLDKYNTKINKNIHGFSDETMKYLQKYHWPGNIRQLENEIERAVTLAENETYLELSNFSPEIMTIPPENSPVDSPTSTFKETMLIEEEAIDLSTNMKEALEQVEKKIILKALQQNHNNQSATAKMLDISRQGLIQKLRKYKIGNYDY